MESTALAGRPRRATLSHWLLLRSRPSSPRCPSVQRSRQEVGESRSRLVTVGTTLRLHGDPVGHHLPGPSDEGGHGSERVAPIDVPVLIVGESGTGKGWSRVRSSSSAAGAVARFETVNCVTLTRELLLGELFGHERDAFTGAAGPPSQGRVVEVARVGGLHHEYLRRGA